MITRKIGKLILGKATPAQLMLACILGAMLGFMPGFFQAAGLIIFMVILLIILNANLLLAGIVLIISEIISFPLLPISFYIGRGLLDGPLQPLFKWLVNTPVLAFFGFDYYATVGALVLGLIFGIIVGAVVITALKRFRIKMASLEEGSDRYKKWASKWWVKLVMFIVFSKGEVDFTKAAGAKGKIIRPVGVVLAALLVVLIIVIEMFFSGPIVVAALKSGLEKVNGATVDIASAQLEPAHGKLEIKGLAMADPNNLDTDLLRAKQITIDIDISDLLTKRIAMNKVVLEGSSTGAKRKFPGHIVGSKPKPTPESKAPKPEGEQKTIKDYLKDAKKWKQRLAQIRRWLDKLNRSKPDSDKAKKTKKQRIENNIEQYGYASIRDSSLIEKTPAFTIYSLIAKDVKALRVKSLDNQTLDIEAQNLATQSWLLNKETTITVKSSKNTLIAQITQPNKPAAKTKLHFAYNDVKTDSIAGQLKVDGDKSVVSGGVIDFDLSGNFSPENLDLPLDITLHNTNINIPGAGSQKVSKLTIPVALKGPMDNPRITITKKQIGDALKQAGADIIGDKLKDEADKQVNKLKDKLFKKKKGDKNSDKKNNDKDSNGKKKNKSKDNKKLLNDLFDNKKKDDKK